MLELYVRVNSFSINLMFYIKFILNLGCWYPTETNETSTYTQWNIYLPTPTEELKEAALINFLFSRSKISFDIFNSFNI